MPLTPRERVNAVLAGDLPDQVPIVVGPSNATGIQMGAYKALKDHLGIQAPDQYLYDWPELGTAKLDQETFARLGGDIRGVLDAHPESTFQKNAGRDPGEPFIDSWGIGQVEVEPGVWFPAIHPLEGATTIQELEDYSGWPDVTDQSRVAHVEERAVQLEEQDPYGIMGTPWLLFPFERAIGLQGMESFFVNLIEHREFAEALLHKCAELCKGLMEPFLQEAGEHIDIIKIGDDLGTSANLLISPKMYREILKPIHREYIQFIKSRTNAKLFFHTDGDVSSLMEDFVEIGIDILNPIQTSAGAMSDLPTLKKRYGDDLIFCGAIDTSHILPYGSPAEVRQEVRRVIRILGEGGGYMLAAVHTIQRDVPPENILAMVDAAQEFGAYPFKD